MKSVMKAALLAALILLVASPPASSASIKIDGPQDTFVKLGFLMQGRAEVEDTADADDQYENIYFRRLRILASGKISDRLSFFMETDSPNLGKYDPATDSKIQGDMFIQDFFVTYTWRPEIKLDAGMILLPVSRNSETSAAKLLPLDYGAYSFVASAPSGSRVGRDYGAQLRGHLFDEKLEYRAGIYQGDRDLGGDTEGAGSSFRYVARLVYYFAGTETGFFYTGTSLGRKEIFSLGFSMDAQEEYRSYAGDLYIDKPLESGDAVTFQLNYIYYDGDDTYPAIEAQNDWLVEACYYNDRTKLGPFMQLAFQDFADEEIQDEDRYQAGIAWYPDKYNLNLKAAYTVIFRPHTQAAQKTYRDNYSLQLQVLYF